MGRAATTIGERFENQPGIDAELRHTIGTTYARLGLFERAEEQLASMESQYEAWLSENADRRQKTIAQAEEEMARPLPVPAD